MADNQVLSDTEMMQRAVASGERLAVEMARIMIAHKIPKLGTFEGKDAPDAFRGSVIVALREVYPDAPDSALEEAAKHAALPVGTPTPEEHRALTITAFPGARAFVCDWVQLAKSMLPYAPIGSA